MQIQLLEVTSHVPPLRHGLMGLHSTVPPVTQMLEREGTVLQ